MAQLVVIAVVAALVVGGILALAARDWMRWHQTEEPEQDVW